VTQDAPQVTTEMVAAAAKIAGVPLSEEAQKRAVESLNRPDSLLKSFQILREMNLGNDTPLALVFNPVLPGVKLPRGESFIRPSKIKATVPKTDEDLAFLPVLHLAQLLKKRNIKSMDLTKICLERLKKYDPSSNAW